MRTETDRRRGLRGVVVALFVLVALAVLALGSFWLLGRALPSGTGAPDDETVAVDDRLDRMEVLASDTRGIQQLIGLLLKAGDGGRIDVAHALTTDSAQAREDEAAFGARLDAIRARYGEFRQTLPTWSNSAPLGRTDDGRRRLEVSYPVLFENSRAAVDATVQATSEGSWRVESLVVRPDE